MTKEEIEKLVLEQATPFCAPFKCQIILQDFSDKEIKLKLQCPQLDVFKVKGKIVTMEDELKNKISNRLTPFIKDIKIVWF